LKPPIPTEPMFTMSPFPYLPMGNKTPCLQVAKRESTDFKEVQGGELGTFTNCHCWKRNASRFHALKQPMQNTFDEIRPSLACPSVLLRCWNAFNALKHETIKFHSWKGLLRWITPKPSRGAQVPAKMKNITKVTN
jgi:hypothetical protein